MAGRVVLLVSTPRVAPGLLTREAWSTLEQADAVWGVTGEPQPDAVVESGVELAPGDPSDPAALARRLVAAAATSVVVWVGSSDGDPG
ncbi:MAG: nucleoside triphosphate pyrophosphohydrolase, partial [Terracoccus sp.]